MNATRTLSISPIEELFRAGWLQISIDSPLFGCMRRYLFMTFASCQPSLPYQHSARSELLTVHDLEIEGIRVLSDVSNTFQPCQQHIHPTLYTSLTIINNRNNKILAVRLQCLTPCLTQVHMPKFLNTPYSLSTVGAHYKLSMRMACP
jgi:hypothetical protein